MLARVDIENKEGLCLLQYFNPKERMVEGKRFHAEAHGDLVFRGFFSAHEDSLIAKGTLHSLVLALNAQKDHFVLKKHAHVYAYIENFLTTKNPIYPIPREPLAKKAGQKCVYVDVRDTIERTSKHGRDSYIASGKLVVRPTADVGRMSLKIDSRSLCSTSNHRYGEVVKVKREGISTLLSLPSAAIEVMHYSFVANEKDLVDVSLLVKDAETLEVHVSPPEAGTRPKDLLVEIFLGEAPSSTTVHYLVGKAAYYEKTKSVVWKIGELVDEVALSIHTSAGSKEEISVTYSYRLHGFSASSILVTNLCSDADENWIKHNTHVSGVLRLCG